MNTNDIWLIAGLGNPEAKYDGTQIGRAHV